MARGDRGLHLVRAGAAPPQRSFQQRGAFGDRRAVPLAAVLFLERDQLAAGTVSRTAAGMVEQEQREQSGGLCFVRHQGMQQPGQPDRFGRQIGTLEFVALAGRVALVEQQVQHAEHGGGALGQQMRGRHPVRDRGGADLAFHPDEALRHGRFGNQERAGDLRGAEPGERAQRERHLCFERERGMAAGEDEPEPVVLDPAVFAVSTVDGCWFVRDRQPRRFPEFARSRGGAPDPVDGTVAGGGGEPCSGVLGHAVARPGAHGERECVLGAFLGQVPVAGDADEGGHDGAPLVAERLRDRGFGRVVLPGHCVSLPVRACGRVPPALSAR